MRTATRLDSTIHGVPLFTLYGTLYGVVTDAAWSHVYADIHETEDGGYTGSRITAHTGIMDPDDAIRLHLMSGQGVS